MRGELKLMENVIAFFMIIIIGMIALIFFSMSQNAQNQQRAQQLETVEAVQAARALYNLPELACTYSESGRCIDAYKAQAFSELEVDTVYFGVFGRSEIALRCIGCENNVSIYDQLESNTYRQIQVPVTVSNATSGIDHFGWIEVRI